MAKLPLYSQIDLQLKMQAKNLLPPYYAFFKTDIAMLLLHTRSWIAVLQLFLSPSKCFVVLATRLVNYLNLKGP
jgi:hypothetical protein